MYSIFDPKTQNSHDVSNFDHIKMAIHKNNDLLMAKFVMCVLTLTLLSTMVAAAPHNLDTPKLSARLGCGTLGDTGCGSDPNPWDCIVM